MSQVRAIIKAFRIRAALNRLALAKENALREMAGLPPIRSCCEECYIYIMDAFRKCCCAIFCPCCTSRTKRKRLSKYCCGRTCTPDTIANDNLKTVIGFLSGIAISYLFYLQMAIQMGLPITTALIVASVISFVFSLGLAFFDTFRCILFLMLPAFTSSKGRSFLLMYATILILNHPVANFNHNIIVMSECATCGQDMAINETKKLLGEALSPVGAIIDRVQLMIKGIHKFSMTIKNAFMSLKRAVKEIGEAVKRVKDWLTSLVDICNENMGAPYRRCKQAFDDAMSSCRQKLGPFDFMCSIVDWVSNICHIARAGELFCVITQAITEHVGRAIGEPVAQIMDKVSDMFYFNITIDYHYNLTMTQSKSYDEVKAAITKDIINALANLNIVIKVADHIMLAMVGFVVIKALMYRYKFLTRNNFDNTFITYYLQRIDQKRDELGRETIFPLTADEMTRYGKASTSTLYRSERKKVAKGIILWIFAASHASFYVLCDYGLYWILTLVRKHFEIKINTGIPPHVKLHVQGEGAMADMYRALLTVIDPLSENNLDIDTTHCLPNPAKPNYLIYQAVLAIYIICLIMSIGEGYFLRLRHIIAGCYYPKRAQQRAMWLHSHILQTRGGFIKFARRQIRKKYQNQKDTESASIRSRLAANYPFIRKILKFFGYERKFCLLCSKEGTLSDDTNFQSCANIDCNAVYCLGCFDDLQNTCTVCMDPVDYGDLSDISEERDSSEDEEELKKKKIEGKKTKAKFEEKQQERSPARLLGNFQGAFGFNQKEVEEASSDSSDSEEDDDDESDV